MAIFLMRRLQSLVPHRCGDAVMKGTGRAMSERCGRLGWRINELRGPRRTASRSGACDIPVTSPGWKVRHAHDRLANERRTNHLSVM
jgi:hypothetical protein